MTTDLPELFQWHLKFSSEVSPDDEKNIWYYDFLHPRINNNKANHNLKNIKLLTNTIHYKQLKTPNYSGQQALQSEPHPQEQADGIKTVYLFSDAGERLATGTQVQMVI